MSQQGRWVPSIRKKKEQTQQISGVGMTPEEGPYTGDREVDVSGGGGHLEGGGDGRGGGAEVMVFKEGARGRMRLKTQHWWSIPLS